jgi:hypothetical protein
MFDGIFLLIFILLVAGVIFPFYLVYQVIKLFKDLKYLNSIGVKSPVIEIIKSIMPRALTYEKTAKISPDNKIINPTILFNAGLVRAVLKRYISDQSKIDDDQQKFNITVAGLLLGSKSAETSFAFISYILIIILYLALCSAFSLKLNIPLLVVLLICILLVQIRQSLLKFRIERGYYGLNDYEAREMIEFLLNHSEKADFSDGDGMKILFPKPKEIEEKQPDITGPPEVAR